MSLGARLRKQTSLCTSCQSKYISANSMPAELVSAPCNNVLFIEISHKYVPSKECGKDDGLTGHKRKHSVYLPLKADKDRVTLHLSLTMPSTVPRQSKLLYSRHTAEL